MMKSLINGALVVAVVTVVLVSQVHVTQANREEWHNTTRLVALCEGDHASIDSVGEALYLINGVKYLRNETYLSDRCKQEFDSIIALEPILRDNGDVCRPEHIKKMINYKRVHLVPKKALAPKRVLNGIKRKPLIRHFFKRYVFSVSQVCRSNMIENLKDAEKQINVDDLRALLPEHRVDESHSIASSNNNDSVTTGFKLFNSIKSVLGGLSSVENFVPIGPLTDVGKIVQPTLHLHEREYQEFETLIKRCGAFAKHYETAILSVVRLASVGYVWKLGDVDEEYSKASASERRMVKDWLDVAQVCHTLTSIRIEKTAQEGAADEPVVELNHVAPIDFVDSQPGEQGEAQYERNRLNAGLDKLPATDKLIKKHAESHLSQLMTKMKKKLTKTLASYAMKHEWVKKLVARSIKSMDRPLVDEIRAELDASSGNGISMSDHERGRYDDYIFASIFAIVIIVLIVGIALKVQSG